MFLRQRSKPLMRLLIPICLTLIMLFAVTYASAATGRQVSAESLRLTEQSIRRAAIQCYALEGMYAPSLDYLIDNYGIRPDKDSFIVHYQYIGGNLMPDITVLPMSNILDTH